MMTHPMRILIVEDESILLMQMEALLEEAGHVVVGTAMSAQEAIDLINDLSPDLVLLDLHLLGSTSGKDVARSFYGRDDIAVVFVTASGYELAEDMDGALGVLNKPFSESTLMEAIAYLEECVRRPPPVSTLPAAMRLSPAYVESFDAMSRPN